MSDSNLIGSSSELLKRYMLECSMIKPIHVVKKEADSSFALTHFKTEVDASTFHHIYCLQKKAVCPRLGEVKVNPSLIGNQHVKYSSFQVQPHITSSKKILCRCPHLNTANSNSNHTSITNSNDTSVGPSASTTTTNTATTNSNSNSNPSSITKSNDTSADPSVSTTTTTTATTNSNSNSNLKSVTNSSNSNFNTPTSNTINTNATESTVDDWRDDIEAVKLKIRNSIKRKSKEIAELQKRLKIFEQI
ncbi:unnamed protein product [Mucor hiemalis]